MKSAKLREQYGESNKSKGGITVPLRNDKKTSKKLEKIFQKPLDKYEKL